MQVNACSPGGRVMAQRHKLILMCVVAGHVLVLAPGRAAAEWPVRRDGLDLVVETPHYRIRTDLGEDVGQSVATQQEVLFRELYRRMGRIKPKIEFKRFNVLVFETSNRYLAELGDAVRGSRGVFDPTKDVLACWAGAGELDIILRTLRHEGTHQFVMHFIGPECPVWLNEGLAVFYEHGRFVRGRLEVGQVPPARVRIVRRAKAEGDLIPLREMLAMTNREWLGHVNMGSPKAYLQYCQAWSMVHFLAYADQTRYRQAFLQYIHYLARDVSPRSAWYKTFGRDYRGFRERWEAYIEGLEPSSEMECRLHLELLGWLLMKSHGKLPPPEDMAAFQSAVLEGKLGSWHVRTGGGYVVDSADAEKLEMLFRCPNDRDKGASHSYALAASEGDGPPVLRCRHHAGLLLETRYVKNADGEYVDCQVVAVPSRDRRR